MPSSPPVAPDAPLEDLRCPRLPPRERGVAAPCSCRTGGGTVPRFGRAIEAAPCGGVHRGIGARSPDDCAGACEALSGEVLLIPRLREPMPRPRGTRRKRRVPAVEYAPVERVWADAVCGRSRCPESSRPHARVLALNSERDFERGRRCAPQAAAQARGLPLDVARLSPDGAPAGPAHRRERSACDALASTPSGRPATTRRRRSTPLPGSFACRRRPVDRGPGPMRLGYPVAQRATVPSERVGRAQYPYPGPRPRSRPRSCRGCGEAVSARTLASRSRLPPSRSRR